MIWEGNLVIGLLQADRVCNIALLETHAFQSGCQSTMRGKDVQYPIIVLARRSWLSIGTIMILSISMIQFGGEEL